jgi:uncharacterized protein with HEPN domain
LDFASGGPEEFRADRRTQEAIVRELEILGEASKRLSARTKEPSPRVKWKRIAGFRGVAIHRYDALDWDLI